MIKRKKIIYSVILIITAFFHMFGSVILAADTESVLTEKTDITSEWKYTSISIGKNFDDLIIGNLRLHNKQALVREVNETEKSETKLKYIINNFTNDSAMLRTVEGGRDCIKPVSYYCPAREGKKEIDGYLYFDTGLTFDENDREITFEIEYFDSGTKPFRVRYVNEQASAEKTEAGADGMFEVACENTQKWRTARVKVNDAFFDVKNKTCLGDKKCDLRIERLNSNCSVRHLALYTKDFDTKYNSYQTIGLENNKLGRFYFTKGMWTNDSKRMVMVDAENNIYEYNIEECTLKKIVKGDYGVLSPNNFLYYYDSEANVINRISLDTYKTEEVLKYPINLLGAVSNIQVTNDDSRISIQNERSILAVYDIETGELNSSVRYTFGSSRPGTLSGIGHMMINPEYKNLIFFCHEGTTTLISDRLWTIDLETGEKRNVFKQIDNSLDKSGDIITGETSGHENWTADGEHIVFVKYANDTNVGMNGIVRIDKYGENREYINDDYPYWHCHPSADNRFVVADTSGGYIVLVDIKSGKSYSAGKIRVHKDEQKYQPHPAFSPDGRMVSFCYLNRFAYIKLAEIPICRLISTC